MVISNSRRLEDSTGRTNPICRAFDEVVQSAKERLWLAVPWVYTRSDNPWILRFIRALCDAQVRGVKVRAYVRPDPVNSFAVNSWKTARIEVVQHTPRARHLHSKLLISERACLISTANLTDTDLFRNVNHVTVERNRTEGFGSSRLCLEVEVRAPAEQQPGDGTNYLGAIADALEVKRHRIKASGSLDHLGYRREVGLYDNDRQIKEIHYREVESDQPSYAVRLRAIQ